MTAKELSKRLHAHPTYISRLERGSRTIDVIEFTDIAEALGINPRVLYTEFADRAKPRS